MMRGLRMLATAAAAVVAVSCCESPIAPSSATGGGILQLVVTGDNQLAVGDTSQLQATATYEDGTQQNVTSIATWTSNNGAVCTVNGKGLVTAVAQGSCVITAVVREMSGDLPITVGGPGDPNNPDNPNDPDGPTDPEDPPIGPPTCVSCPATLIALNITGVPSVAVGNSIQWVATAFYSNGTQEDVTTQANWSSSTPGIATVNDGLITGVSAGNVGISATYQGQSDTDPLAVTGGDGPGPGNPDLIGLQLDVPVNLTLAQILNGDPVVDLTLYGLYSDGSKQDVTNGCVAIDCLTFNSPQGNNLLEIDDMSTLEVIGLLLQGALDPNHQVNATYGGYTANANVSLALPVLNDLVFQGSGPFNLSLGSNNQLPPLQALFSQGVSSDDVADVLPDDAFDFQLAGPVANLVNAIPVVGPQLLGQLNQVVADLTVEDGALQLTGESNSLLNELVSNPLLTPILGPGGLLPLDLVASANSVSSEPIRINLDQ